MHRRVCIITFALLFLSIAFCAHGQTLTVVVTIEQERPAFLDQLRSDNPEAIQQVARQAGFEVFHKDGIYYLISESLITRSNPARVNRFLQYLLDRFRNNYGQLFTFDIDILPEEIIGDLKGLMGSLFPYLKEKNQFSLKLRFDLYGSLKDGRTFSLSLASIENRRLIWCDYLLSEDVQNDQQPSYVPVEKFYRDYSMSPSQKSICFYFSRDLSPTELMLAIKRASEIVIEQHSKVKKEINQTLRAIQDQMLRSVGIQTGFSSFNQLPPEAQLQIQAYLQQRYRTGISDVSFMEIRPVAILQVHLRRFSLSLPIEYLAGGVKISVEQRVP